LPCVTITTTSKAAFDATYSITATTTIMMTINVDEGQKTMIDAVASLIVILADVAMVVASSTVIVYHPCCSIIIRTGQTGAVCYTTVCYLIVWVVHGRRSHTNVGSLITTTAVKRFTVGWPLE
jgi:hypothetical protein